MYVLFTVQLSSYLLRPPLPGIKWYIPYKLNTANVRDSFLMKLHHEMTSIYVIKIPASTSIIPKEAK